MKKCRQIMTLSALVTTLIACTPTLNWREVRFEDGLLLALMPCKPDAAQRDVTLQTGNQAVVASLQMRGCETNDMQFTLGQMTLPTGMPIEQAMTAWRLGSLAPLNVSHAEAPATPWSLRGASVTPSPIGTQVANTQHQARWVWFVRDGKVYQAGVYGRASAKQLNSVADDYFAGFKLP